MVPACGRFLWSGFSCNGLGCSLVTKSIFHYFWACYRSRIRVSLGITRSSATDITQREFSGTSLWYIHGDIPSVWISRSRAYVFFSLRIVRLSSSLPADKEMPTSRLHLYFTQENCIFSINVSSFDTNRVAMGGSLFVFFCRKRNHTRNLSEVPSYIANGSPRRRKLVGG